ncbi:dipeptidase [Candidatus Bathyarchaeota archaeon]|nr:dipeptidase [Candidatus Bathyarchaeota archaeon]
MTVLKKFPVIDMHEDIGYYYATGGHDGLTMADFSEDVAGRHGDIPKYRKARVRVVFSAVFPLMPAFNPELSRIIWSGYHQKPLLYVNYPRAVKLNILEQVKIYHRLFKTYPEIKPVSEPGDIDRLLESRDVGFLISLEGADGLDEPGDLELLYRLGVRSLQMTWNYDTKYASSCMSRKDYGLTGLGEALVDEANRLGVILDISHVGEKASLEIIEASKLPVIASHANVKTVKKHVRNLSDEVLEALASKGGVVGFTVIPSMISEKPCLEDLVEHILYVCQHYGSELLGLGTDYFGLIGVKPPKGLEDVSKLDGLWEALMDRGLNESDVEAMAYGNALRVLKAHENRWRRLKP